MAKVTRQRGLSLIEVIIATGMMLMLLLAFYAVAEMLQRSQIVTDARLEARQQLRSATRNFALATGGASAFFTGTSATPLTINGLSCVLPYVDGSGVLQQGNTAALAIPIDAFRPTDSNLDPKFPPRPISGTPDGFCDGVYDIVVMTTRPTTPADSRNPDSRQIVLMRWSEKEPSVWLAPLTLDLTSLGPPDSIRYFDAFIEPLAKDGFRVTYQQKGSRPSACLLHAQFSHTGTQGTSQKEKFDFLFTARNIF